MLLGTDWWEALQEKSRPWPGSSPRRQNWQWTMQDLDLASGVDSKALSTLSQPAARPVSTLRAGCGCAGCVTYGQVSFRILCKMFAKPSRGLGHEAGVSLAKSSPSSPAGSLKVSDHLIIASPCVQGASCLQEHGKYRMAEPARQAIGRGEGPN